MQQEHLRGASPLWRASHCNKRNMTIGAVLGLSVATGIAIFMGGEAFAFSPSATISSPGPVSSGSQEVYVGDGGTGIASYQVPVGFNITDSKDFSVYVYANESDGNDTDGDYTNLEYSGNSSGGGHYVLSAFTTPHSIDTVGNETNAWGYRAHVSPAAATNDAIQSSLSTKDYIGIATRSTTDPLVENEDIPQTNTGSSYNGKVTLEFVASVNGDIPSGSYSGGVVVAIVPNPLAVNLFGIKTMQQMTTEACSNTPTPISAATASARTMYEAISVPDYDSVNKITSLVPENTLIDARDGKSYKVRKLADGNCWMVENLKYNPEGQTLKPSETDVKTEKTWAEIKAAFSSGDAQTYMYWPGKTADGAPFKDNIYYNWYGATAGSGAAATVAAVNGIAEESICPANWRLPTGGAVNASTGNGEFQTLITIYDATAPDKIQAEPLKFTTTGLYGSGSKNAATSGSWWSSTSYSTNGAYPLHYGDNSPADAQGSFNRSVHAITVRCIAR